MERTVFEGPYFLRVKDGKELAVYVGKYRPKYGYAEFYKGKANTFLKIRRLACKQCKVGDRVILKDGTKVVLTGRIYEADTKYPKLLKRIKWDK